MTDQLAQAAGTALGWRAAQLIIAKALFLCRHLVLALLLPPTEFGIYAIAVIPLEFALGVTDLGIVPALVQRGTGEARQYDAAWTLGLMRGAAITLALLLVSPLIGQLFTEPRATGVLQLLALRTVLGALTSIRVVDLERKLDFRRLAFIKIALEFVGAVTAIALAPRLGVYAMAIGTIAGTAASVLLSYRLAPHRPRLVLDADAVRPLLHFGRWVLLAGVFGMAGDVAIRSIISGRLGTAELGVYFLAASLTMLPNQMIAAVVGAVAFPIHTRFQHETERAASAFRASVIAMTVVLGPLYVLLFALAPRIVAEVLGPRWAGSVPIIRWLSVASLMGVMFAASTPLFQGLGRPKYSALLYGAFSLTLAVMAWPIVGRFGLSGAGIAQVLAELATVSAAALLVRRVVPGIFAGLAKPIGAVAIATALAGLTAVAIGGQLGGLLGTAVSLLFGAILSVTALYLLDRRLGLGFVRYLARAYPGAAARITML